MLCLVNYDDFISAHPEFSEINPVLVSAMLAQATRRCDPNVFRTTINDAIGWNTCILLDRSPLGFGTRLEAGVSSIYELEFEKLVLESGAGMALVAGNNPILPGRFGCW